MKKTLSLALVTAMACLAAVITAAPAARAAVPSYTGCLNASSNVIVQVAVGEIPASPPCRPGWPEVHFSGGDLTSLTAGTGLTGGGVNGDVSVALAPSFRLPQTCTPSQGTAWNGTGWACASFASEAAFNSLVALLGSPGTLNDGSNPVHWTKLKGVPAGFADGQDDGTTYTSSGAIALSGNDFRLSTQGCSSGEVWKYDGSDWSCEPDESGPGAAEGIHAYCSLVRAHPRSYDGAPCERHSETLDTTGIFPAFLISMTIGTDGNAVMSYQKLVPAGWELMVARCLDPACAASELNSLGIVNAAGAISIGTDGNPVIAFSGGGSALKVAHCDDPACRASTMHTLDGPGFPASMAIGIDGNPVMSYRGPNDALKVARCADPACASSTLHVLDTFGVASSLAIGTDGNPIVSYSGPAFEARVAHCGDPGCATSTLETLDTFAGATSLGIGTDGNPVISYRGPGDELKLASCSDPACAASALHTLDTLGGLTSLAIGTDGNPVLSYSGPGGALKVARCSDLECATSALQTVDSTGTYTSIAIGTDGNPVISYSGPGNALKVARPAILG